MIAHYLHYVGWFLLITFGALLYVWQGLNATDPDPKWSNANRRWAARIMTVVFALVVLAVVNWKP